VPHGSVFAVMAGPQSRGLPSNIRATKWSPSSFGLYCSASSRWLYAVWSIPKTLEMLMSCRRRHTQAHTTSAHVQCGDLNHRESKQTPRPSHPVKSWCAFSTPRMLMILGCMSRGSKRSNPSGNHHSGRRRGCAVYSAIMLTIGGNRLVSIAVRISGVVFALKCPSPCSGRRHCRHNPPNRSNW
jgi:hypothetical protein